jgi:hypothetical protein
MLVCICLTGIQVLSRELVPVLSVRVVAVSISWQTRINRFHDDAIVSVVPPHRRQ